MLGLADKSSTIYLINFGMARSIKDPLSGKHIPFIKSKNLVSTCNFVSQNAH